MEVIQVLKYLLIIVIVAMLGLNVFAYLARGTEIASDTLRILVRLTERITGQLFRTTLTGTKTGLKVVGGAVDDLERVVDGGLERQNKKASHVAKSGFCYVGEQTCVSVTENDTCMSGDVFPTMDVCINPKLRTRQGMNQ
uniref:Uncharacterized protein n=1 Tax=viral metagenome TaxID=1070528 RepID=A0A6C0BW78_9ZZZZ